MSRCQFFNVGGINTTEICTLKCRMCLFHGEQFSHKQSNMRNRTLEKKYVEKFLYELPKGNYQINFASAGEFFVDKNAIHYLKLTAELGFTPTVTSNFTLLNENKIDEILEAGVKIIIASTDACSKDIYKKIRGNENNFDHILKMLSYLKSKKQQYPDLEVQSNNILMGDHSEDEFIEFWQDKVDVVNVSALMIDAFSYNSLPDNSDINNYNRQDCIISVFLNPSGVISPCCSITAYSIDNELDWLPNIKNYTPIEAYNKLLDLYFDKSSPMQELCNQCTSWIRWHPDGNKFLKGVSFKVKADSSHNLNDLSTKNSLLNTFHVYVPKGKRVRPIICANNSITGPILCTLINLSITNGNNFNRMNDNYFANLAKYHIESRKISSKTGVLLFVPKAKYDYIWCADPIKLSSGHATIKCTAAAFEGNIALGLLDVDSDTWYLSPQPLQKRTDVQALVNLFK